MNPLKAIQPLLPLLANDEERRELRQLAANALPQLKMTLTDWAANHANAEVRTKAQDALDALVNE